MSQNDRREMEGEGPCLALPEIAETEIALLNTELRNRSDRATSFRASMFDMLF